VQFVGSVTFGHNSSESRPLQLYDINRGLISDILATS
jgi:hypothetical protein